MTPRQNRSLGTWTRRPPTAGGKPRVAPALAAIGAGHGPIATARLRRAGAAA